MVPKQQEGVDQVFHELKISTGTVEDVLKEWMKDCKIDKHITYHCSRHTAATLAISAGAELYSVSKILGHRNLVSTQVYAKVNLDKKIETVNLTKGGVRLRTIRTDLHKICDAMRKIDYICSVSCIYRAGTQKKKEKRIMAKPIKETPVLYDDDAERLEMAAHNVVPLTDEERKEIMKAYEDVKRCCAL